MNLSVKHYQNITILFILPALASGCGTIANIPLTPDKNYPEDWPAIITAGEQCKDISGTYFNEGTAVDEEGSLTSVFLSSLLERQLTIWEDRWVKTKSATLEVVTKRMDANGDSVASLEVVLNGDPDDPKFEEYSAGFTDREGLNICPCVKNTLVIGMRRTGGSAFRIAGHAEEQFLLLTKTSDGSLIAKTRKTYLAHFLLFPYYKRSYRWAVFRPTEEP